MWRIEEASSVPRELAVLRECLAAVSDPRDRRGKVHPLVSVLSLSVLALTAGARSTSDISRWGKTHPELLAPLELRRSPSAATLERLFRLVSAVEVRAALVRYARYIGEEWRGEAGLDVHAPEGGTLFSAPKAGQQVDFVQLVAALVVASGQVMVATDADEGDRRGTVAGRFPGLIIFVGKAPSATPDLGTEIGARLREYLLRYQKTN